MPLKTIERNPVGFARLIDELKETTAIVEGVRDERALKTLGINKIVRISGKPLVTVVEQIACSGEPSKVVILTDFDRKGRAIAARLRALLELRRIPVDMRLRNMLMQYGKGRIEDFNGIARFAYIGEGDGHGEACADFNKVHNKSAHKGQWGSGKA
ncbi:MAG: hypothetical protein HY367_03780 [Candidatus Aenigmarchaeota archaeon]|nr:hypothetical protein [Candidatus Aenigmarchaeota archaeon]